MDTRDFRPFAGFRPRCLKSSDWTPGSNGNGTKRPNADGDCEASLDKPQLFGVEVEPDVDDWQCWRYRVSTVVVPMRNLVLGLR